MKNRRWKPKMEYAEIQEEKVPVLGLGTWQLTGQDCVESVENALRIGYRHIDTAQAYGNEEEVGKGIENSDVSRGEIWLTTKLWRDNLNQGSLKASVDESLRKLQTEYVDLLLIHWPFREMDLAEVLKEMDELVEEGKVRNIGVSNFTATQLEKAEELSENPILTNQVEYHPFLNQDIVLEKCREMDSMLTAYSPLARGEVVNNKILKEIGSKYGKSAAQIVLRWLIQQENVCAIPKATSKEHQKSNIEIFDFKLSEEDMQKINELKGSQRKVDPNFAPDWD